MADNDRLSPVIGRLMQMATDRVNKRQPVEKRWLEDLRQYHGQYDPEILDRLKAERRSTLFVNLTASKADAMAAKLQDLLFPTDDRNWGIGPTPVPELETQAKAAAEAKRKASAAVQSLAEQAAQGDQAAAAQLQEMQAKLAEAESLLGGLTFTKDEARRRAEAMAVVMDDQLAEGSYHAAMRDVIDDACKLGTGVCKGPVNATKGRRRWDVDAMGNARLSPTGDDPTKVRFDWVNPWGFFPDMDCANIADGNGIFYRHLMTPAKLRKLQHTPGFNKDVLRELLRSDPRNEAPSYLADLRVVSGEGSINSTKGFYQVWEYSGPLSSEDLQSIASETGDAALLDGIGDDPLQEIMVVLWFCQDKLLKIEPYPLDSGEPLYSVFNLKKDETTPFGFGVPRIMRDPQAMLNAAARMMMNNLGVAAGPQIVVDKAQLSPEDGNYTLAPFKVWVAKDGIPKDEDYLRVYHIDSHQAELAATMAIAQKHIDDETGLTALAQGDQGSGITKTAAGMAILINATNVVFRRIVKNFDDDVTVPNIKRLYEWNMQFHPRAEIKGDYEVDARGSSVLLARELQAQNLRLFALEFGQNPDYAPMLKKPNLLRQTVRTLMLPMDEIVYTDDEIRENAEKEQKAAQAQLEAQAAMAQQQGMNPEQLQQIEMRKLELAEQKMVIDAETANADRQRDYDVALIERDTSMIKMAETQNFELEKMDRTFADRDRDRAFKAKQIAVETIMKRETGTSAGGII